MLRKALKIIAESKLTPTLILKPANKTANAKTSITKSTSRVIEKKWYESHIHRF